jgi:hypothetical protein
MSRMESTSVIREFQLPKDIFRYTAGRELKPFGQLGTKVNFVLFRHLHSNLMNRNLLLPDPSKAKSCGVSSSGGVDAYEHN